MILKKDSFQYLLPSFAPINGEVENNESISCSKPSNTSQKRNLWLIIITFTRLWQSLCFEAIRSISIRGPIEQCLFVLWYCFERVSVGKSLVFNRQTLCKWARSLSSLEMAFYSWRGIFAILLSKLSSRISFVDLV